MYTSTNGHFSIREVRDYYIQFNSCSKTPSFSIIIFESLQDKHIFSRDDKLKHMLVKLEDLKRVLTVGIKANDINISIRHNGSESILKPTVWIAPIKLGDTLLSSCDFRIHKRTYERDFNKIIDTMFEQWNDFLIDNIRDDLLSDLDEMIEVVKEGHQHVSYNNPI